MALIPLLHSPVQARVEVGILQMLNSKADPGNKHHIVRMCDFFVHRLHLCLVFELLAVNLYELIKRNQFRGLSIGLLRVFVTQARSCLHPVSILHRLPRTMLPLSECVAARRQGAFEQSRAA